MATTFPTSLDTFTNITDPTNTTLETEVGGRTHSEFHNDYNDAIEALEARVGVTGSAVTTSHAYKIATLETDVATLFAENFWVQKTVTITPTEVRNMFSQPITLVSAPGAGKALLVQSTSISMIYNGTTYVNNTDLKVTYGFGGASIATFTTFLSNTTDKVVFSNNTNIPATINTSVQIYTDVGNTTLGNSTIKVTVWYKTITL